MPAPATVDEFLKLVHKSGLLHVKQVRAYVRPLREQNAISCPRDLGDHFIRDGLLTPFQVQHLLSGKYRGFSLGKYRVLAPLGSGGMSAVYLCLDPSRERLVAVKVLPKDLAKDPTLVKRFQREARAGMALDHPNIVRCFEIAHDRDLHYLVMEYVEGISLHELVTKHGPLPVERATDYVLQAAEGLEHASESGMVHRDIKPGNLLINRSGDIKILDMGLLRLDEDDDSILTRDVLGTIDFLAPEQAVDSHDVDTRADIYALGATFYFLLTGASPLEIQVVDPTERPGQVLKAIRKRRSDVPDDLTAIMIKMIAADRSRRYQTPGDVADALEPWVQDSVTPPTDVEIPPVGQWEAVATSQRKDSKRRSLAWAMAILIMLGGIGAWFYRTFLLG